MTRTLSIAIKENTYQELKSKVGLGKISSFVNQAVEKKLAELTQKEKNEREELHRQLIAGYKSTVANKELQKELEVWDKIEEEDINDDE